MGMFLYQVLIHDYVFGMLFMNIILQFLQASSLDLKENLSGSPWPYPPVYPTYDAALAGYHFNG
jgi:hypothetical protein